MKKLVFLLHFSILLAFGCVPVTSAATSTINLISSKTPEPTRNLIPTQTSTFVSTIVPTFRVTPTSTPQPALIEHTWKPDTILIGFEALGGLCSPCLPHPPQFILYADGTLVKHEVLQLGNDHVYKYFYKKLSREEICGLLNAIDQNGFFDFDPSTYSVDGNDGLDWKIEVNAWRSKKVSLYALGEAMNTRIYSPQQVDDFMIPPSIVNTYTLLEYYPIDDLESYPPSPLGIWVWKSSTQKSDSSVIWGVGSISLSQLFEKVGSPVNRLPRPIILEGKVAEEIYQAFDKSEFYGEVVDDGKTYNVYVRPILPHEVIVGEQSVISPPLDKSKTSFTLSCKPSDDVMAIPSPTK